jgi:hypothetical protein
VTIRAAISILNMAIVHAPNESFIFLESCVMQKRMNHADLTGEKSAIKTVVITGLVAGTLDAIGAIVHAHLAHNVLPMAVFRFVASGFFGKEAFAGGIPMAIYGIIFHYLIATSWTLFFFLIYPRVAILARNKYITGLTYGIFVWLVMNVIVLPLTNIPHGGGIKFPGALIGMGILMIAIGLPISIFVSKYYHK